MDSWFLPHDILGDLALLLTTMGLVAAVRPAQAERLSNRVELPTLALEPELAPLPEDVRRGEVAKLANAEPGVEQGPDDELLGGCLAGIGQSIRFVGRERLSHVLIRHLPPPKSCVLGVGTRSHCAFLLPG